MFQGRWEELMLEAARLHDEALGATHSIGAGGSFPSLDSLSAWEESHHSEEALPGPVEFLRASILDEESTQQASVRHQTPHPSTQAPVMSHLGETHTEIEQYAPHKGTMSGHLSHHHIEGCLSSLKKLNGFVGVCLADTLTGESLAQIGGGRFDLAAAAAANSEMLRVKGQVLQQMSLKEPIEDILIILHSQYHLLRLSHRKKELFFYLVLDRDRASLALARMALDEVEKELWL